MIDGNPNEFIDGLHYGDERFFLFRGRKYFIQGYSEKGRRILEMFTIDSDVDVIKWEAFSLNKHYPVEAFEKAKIFDGKSFWEVENEIQWVDD